MRQTIVLINVNFLIVLMALPTAVIIQKMVMVTVWMTLMFTTGNLLKIVEGFILLTSTLER